MIHYIPQPVPDELAFDLTNYAVRRQLTHARRCYMEGGWEEQLAAAMAYLLSDAARLAMPCMDCSHNIFRDTISRLSSRYEDPPEIRTGDVGPLGATELFAVHGEVERAALAYNAAALSLRWMDGELVLDVLPPDHCDVLRDRAGRVTRVRLARPLGTCRSTAADYTLEEWDLENAVFSTFNGGRWVPEKDYPWRHSDGRAYAPVVLYRATRPPDFWGAKRWPELIEATLEEGIAWTVHRYGRLNAASGTPYVLDASAVGQSPDESGSGVVRVVTGPNLVLQLTSASGKTGSAGVLQATFDPEKDVKAIVAAFNSRMSSLGLGDNAIQRSGPESGLAIIIRREGLLRLRKSTQALFLRADLEYLEKAASMVRTFGGESAKGGPFALEYAPVAMGQADNQERREQERHDLDIGITTPLAIRAKRDGITIEEAREAMLRDGLNPNPPPPSPDPSPQAQRTTTAPGGDAAAATAGRPQLQQVRFLEASGEGPYVGMVDFQGLKIDVEAAAGDTREGVAQDGTPWSVVMSYDYGEIRGTRGTDGDKLDAYLGPNHDSALVVLVNQHDPLTGAYDEQKVMLGFDREEDAIAAYQAQYPAPGFYVEGDYEVLPFGKFWRLLKSRKTRGKRIDGTDFA